MLHLVSIDIAALAPFQTEMLLNYDIIIWLENGSPSSCIVYAT